MTATRVENEYDRWCAANGCSHGHCPLHCEHPQPALLADGRFVCMRCLVSEVVTEMVPCTPDTCD